MRILFLLLQKWEYLSTKFEGKVKGILLLFLLVLLLGSSFCLLGFCTPAEYKSEVSKEFDFGKTTLWELVSTPEGYAKLRGDLVSFELLNNEGTAWHEFDKNGMSRKLQIVSLKKEEKMIVKVYDYSLGIEKTRTYRVYGDSESSVLTVSESSIIDKLLLRSSMVLSGRDLGIKKEIQSLGQAASL